MNAKKDVAQQSRIFQLGVVVAVILGVCLRLRRLEFGTSSGLEEAIPLRVALQMWGYTGQPGDLNPHMFQYPSLTVYLHYALQKAAYFLGHMQGRYASPADYLLGFITNPGPALRLSRGLSIAADVVSIVYASLLGRRLGQQTGLLAAALIATSVTLVVASTAIFTDSVLAALSLAAIHQMAVHAEVGTRRSLLLGAVLTGLACGAKYSGACLFVPMSWAVWQRSGRGAWKSLVIVAGVAGLAFVATTPYALLDWPTFLADVTVVGDRIWAGHLGAVDVPGAAFSLQRLLKNFGWPGILAVAASAVVLRTSRIAVLAWLAFAAFALPTALAKAEFDRYMVPLVAFAALLASVGATWMVGKLPSARAGFGWCLAGVVLLGSTLPGTIRAVLASRSTQDMAREWFESEVGGSDLIVQEAYGAEVLTRAQREALIHSPLFGASSPESQRRYLSRRWYHVVGLPLIVAGPAGVQVGKDWSPIVQHAVDLNAAAYDLRLFKSVDYVVTTGAVRGRYEADTARFAKQCAFYRFLDTHAERIASFSSGPGVEGPTVRVYRLGVKAQEALEDEGRLPPTWWSDDLLAPWPSTVSSLVAGESPIASGRQQADAATNLYVRWYAPFVGQLISDEYALGRCQGVWNLALPHVEILPEDSAALLAGMRCAGALGLWGEARALAERILPRLAQRGWIDPEIALEYARELAHTGDVERARKGLERLGADPDTDVASRARQQLLELDRK